MIANNLKKRIYTSVVLLILVCVIFSFDIILTYTLLVLGVLSLLELIKISKKLSKIKSILFCQIFFLLSIYLLFV